MNYGGLGSISPTRAGRCGRSSRSSWLVMLHRRIIGIEHTADWSQFVTFHGGLAVTTIQLSALFLYQFAAASSWCYFPMLSVGPSSRDGITEMLAGLTPVAQNIQHHPHPLPVPAPRPSHRPVAIARLLTTDYHLPPRLAGTATITADLPAGRAPGKCARRRRPQWHGEETPTRDRPSRKDGAEKLESFAGVGPLVACGSSF